MKLLRRGSRAPEKPACVPAGVSHVEYVALEAIAALRRDDKDTAQINFAHALYVATTKRELDLDEAKALFGALTEGCW